MITHIIGNTIEGVTYDVCYHTLNAESFVIARKMNLLWPVRFVVCAAPGTVDR